MYSVHRPPPWDLTGSGIILVAHFPEAFVRSQGFLAPYQQRSYRGWIGTVMLVDYQTTPVGPYQELLFVPGLFRFGRKLSFSISKIYVSSYDSVWNGRHNWAIPKEQANFSFTTGADTSQTIAVTSNEQPILSVRARPKGPSFPITTRLIPGFQIIQNTLIINSITPDSGGGLLLTRPHATGSARLASLSDLRVNSSLFPDLKRIKPIVSVVIDNFRMTFPAPQLC